jgi:hypothetical protein
MTPPMEVRAGAIPANAAREHRAHIDRAQKIGWTPHVARVLATPMPRNADYLGQRVALQHDANGKDRMIALGRDRGLDRRAHDRGRGIAD